VTSICLERVPELHERGRPRGPKAQRLQVAGDSPLGLASGETTLAQIVVRGCVFGVAAEDFHVRGFSRGGPDLFV
jgi:hypothetical protein